MNNMNPKVDDCLNRPEKWRAEFAYVRSIALNRGLTEELKWGAPCYTYQDGNVVLMHGFKDYGTLLLFKGAARADPAGILIAQSENTQSSRQIRFTELSQSDELEPILEAYIDAAFAALTPGRLRAYILHFAAPKQAKTRAARVEKSIPRMLAGKGLDDE
jgi:uncharacterized protein YdeI (YjbR/CyaY-like superfamily)